MKAITSSIIALGLSLGAFASSHAATTSVSVFPTDTKTLLTVPKNRSAVVRSIVVSNPGVAAVCSQQILRGEAVKADLCVPAGSSFQMEFSPALLYKRNESIELSNGDAVTTTNFTVNYRIIPPGKGLYEKEE